MARHEDLDEDSGRLSVRHYLLMFGTGAAVIALMAAGVLFLLSGEKDSPRKVQDLQIVAIVPPSPPPPPPPPPEQKQEEKVIDQVPVKQEMIDEKPVDTPKDAPPDEDEPLPGPPALDDAGKGPGDLAGKPGGRGWIGGGGGGGGGGSSRWGYYNSLAQSQIKAVLEADKKSRHAAMSSQTWAKIRVWVDPSGRVTRVLVNSNSGDTELDDVLRSQTLSTMVLREPPPKDMPMPIVIRLNAQKPS